MEYAADFPRQTRDFKQVYKKVEQVSRTTLIPNFDNKVLNEKQQIFPEQ